MIAKKKRRSSYGRLVYELQKKKTKTTREA